jgi:hypothetical protein
VEGDRYVKTGCWDSIHVIEAVENDSRTSATYKLTTTVMLHMGVDRPELGDTVLSGSLTRQVRADVIRVGGSAYMRPGSSRRIACCL